MLEITWKKKEKKKKKRQSSESKGFGKSRLINRLCTITFQAKADELHKNSLNVFPLTEMSYIQPLEQI